MTSNDRIGFNCQEFKKEGKRRKRETHPIDLIFFFFALVCESDHVCDSLVPSGKNGTCYQGGLTVFENFQQCDVTSKSSEIFFSLCVRFMVSRE